MADNKPQQLNIRRKKVYPNGHEQWFTVGKITLFGDIPADIGAKLCEKGINVDIFSMEGTCIALPNDRSEKKEAF